MLLTWLKHPHIDWPHGRHESRACLEFILLHSSIIFIYLIVVWSGENSKSNIFLSGCANENFKENGENPFLFL